MGRIAEEEREKLHVRLDKIEQIFYINSGDFIPKSRKYECTNGAQTLVVWAFSNNLNQYAKKANETGKLYEEDIAEIKKINNEQTELLKKVLEVVIHLYEEDSKKRK